MKMRLSTWSLIVISLLMLSACGGSDGYNGATIQPDPNEAAPTATPEPESTPDTTADDSDSDSVANTLDNCPEAANAEQVDSDVDGEGDVCDPITTSYTFENTEGVSTVSYTGQTARQVLLSDLASTMDTLVRDVASESVIDDLKFYYNLDAATRDSAYTAIFALSGGEGIIVNDSDAAAAVVAPGSISSGKDIFSKIAGQDSAGHILGGEFFGWEGIDSPAALMEEYLRVLGEESTDTTDTITVSGGDTPSIATAIVTEAGLDLRQLMQKLLLGAMTFSQGTADYLSIDYGSEANLTLAAGATYTEGAHDFDEAFGYFGAARNYGEVDDATISAGYTIAASDVNADGAIDLRSEYSFANSQNCAKRDLATVDNANPTNYSKEVFDAFVLGRQILQNAAIGASESAPGSLSDAAAAVLDQQILIAAQTWEKCIAATVVHYINDVTGDMGSFVGDDFADLDNFLNLAKHWGEMKGFALGLQFSPYSPFRTGEVVVDGVAQAVDVDIEDLKQVLALMGDAPVLADGTQDTSTDNTENGSLYKGAADAAAAKAAYLADLNTARALLETAYAFDSENVEKW